MNGQKRIINFSNIKNDCNKIENISSYKLSLKKEPNSLDISNAEMEIDFTIKKITKKKEENFNNKILITGIKELNFNNINKPRFSKKIKLENRLTLPYTISSSNRKVKNLSNTKKNLWFKSKSKSNSYICNDNNSDIKTQKDSKNLCITLTEPNKTNVNIKSLFLRKNINNFISGKKLIYSKRDSKSSRNSKNLSIDYYKAFQCIFCEQVFKENEMSKLITCGHKFCNKCGENYFNELIDNDCYNQKFKCPFVKCQKEITYLIIESLLSSKNYDTLRINQMKQDNEITYRNFISKENNKENNLNKLGNYSLKKRNNKINNNNNKYIIDINNLKNVQYFYLESKKIFILCPKCGENTLYRKANKYFLKCLNCKNKFCKFCMRLLKDNHFSQDNINRCKVYFRINKYKKKNFFTVFIQQIFLIIAGYLFLLTFFINKIKNLYRHKYKYLIIQNIMGCFLYFILSIVFFPIIILLIPYYPIISCF